MDRALVERVERYIADNRDRLVEDWKALVRIRSVSEAGADGYPFGRGCARVLEKAVALSLEKGLRAHNSGYRYGTAGFGSGVREIGIFSHLDVVEEGEGWLHDPYDPVERDGWLIGRGVGDNKSAAVLGLYVLGAFAELNLPLERSRLLLYFGCNEEKGMADIESFLIEHPMPACSLVPDLYFPVCHGEKGSMKLRLRPRRRFGNLLDLQGGLAENMVPERARAELALTDGLLEELAERAAGNPDIDLECMPDRVAVSARGKTAMSSMPEGSRNAIGLLAGFLAGIGALGADRALWAEMERLTLPHDGSTLGIAQEDDPSGKLTCVCVFAELNGEVPALSYNIRYPVTDRGERVRADATQTADAMEWDALGFVDNPPLYLPADHPYVRLLCDSYTEFTGRAREPYVIGGGTYARKLRRAVAFGAGNGSRNPFLPPGHGGVHQPDESRPIEAILEAVKVYILTILRLDAMEEDEFEALWAAPQAAVLQHAPGARVVGR